MKQYKSIPEFEKVQFQVSDLESTASGIAQMAAREVDLGFGAKVEQAGCCYFEVMSEELVAVVPINHPFAQKENITMQELCQEPLITYNHKCGTRYDLEHFFHKYVVSPQQIFEAQNEKNDCKYGFGRNWSWNNTSDSRDWDVSGCGSTAGKS